MNPEGTVESLGLMEFIELLRSELDAATDQGRSSDLAFDLGDIELEVSIQVASAKKGEAGLKFWVVTAGGEFGTETSRTHRLKLNLTPTRRGSPGDRVKVRDLPPESVR